MASPPHQAALPLVGPEVLPQSPPPPPLQDQQDAPPSPLHEPLHPHPLPMPVVPHPQAHFDIPDAPPVTLKTNPSPDASTTCLRLFVSAWLNNERLTAQYHQMLEDGNTDTEEYRNLRYQLKVNEDVLGALKHDIKDFEVAMVTNYSEYWALEKMRASRSKMVWVHRETSPQSVACIQARAEKSAERFQWRCLFESDLTNEELAMEKHTLFASKFEDWDIDFPSSSSSDPPSSDPPSFDPSSSSDPPSSYPPSSDHSSVIGSPPTVLQRNQYQY